MIPTNSPAHAGAGRAASRSLVHTHALLATLATLDPTGIHSVKPDPFRIHEPRPDTTRICQITRHRIGRDAFLFEPEGAEGGEGAGGAGGNAGDGGAGGTGDTPPPRTFTQADVDRVVGQRLAEERKRFAGFDDLKAQAARAAELEAENQRMREEAETRGKSAEEKQRIEAERARKQIERDRAEFQSKLEAESKRATDLEGRLRNREISLALGTALDVSKVLPQARDKAIRAFVADSQIEIDENYQVTAISYGGVAYDTPAKAAAAFLKDNDFFAAASVSSGGGTRPPNGGGVSGQDVRKQSAEENFAAGLSTPPRPAPGLSGA